VWFHAVSVGEVNLLRLIIQRLTAARPAWAIVVSTTTRTGYEVAKRRFPQFSVFYCPLDFSWAVARAMRRVRPSCLVLAELELWPNLLRAARDIGAATAVINGRLSQTSFRRYSRLGPRLASRLFPLDLVAAQSQEYGWRFAAVGIARGNVHVTGSMKFDGLRGDREHPEVAGLRALAGLARDDFVFLAGSTQEPEEPLAIETFRQLSPSHPRLKLIIVPRHPERFERVARLLGESGLPWRRKSELSAGAGGADESRVLLVDTVGELSAWWGTADAAFVGGSIGNRGGQNMLEPAAYGASVCFGPNTRNFREIVELLLDRNAAVVVHSGAELTAFVRRAIEDPPWAEALGRRARELVAAQAGATDRTRDLVLQLSDSRTPALRRSA
jgi:3-deoxy-D-manno-octulosonic-acid transferase